jgi:hypothetical protein
VRSCSYQVVVWDYHAGGNGPTRPKRAPGARGTIVTVRRKAGTAYLPRVIVDRRHTRDVPGGARATRAQAEAALDLELALTRPCGADVYGDGDRCYWHAKLTTPPEVNGHEQPHGWHTIDLGELKGFDPLERRMRDGPPPTCYTCGRPTRIGERGPIMYCSSACKSTGQARRRHGFRPAISRSTGRLLVRDRRDATA